MRHRRAPIALAAAAALGLAGCGGGERQDANEAAATYSVDVVDASFAKRQHVAETTEMRLDVKNTGDEAIPLVAVTVDSFTRRASQPGLADAERPVWIVDRGPRAGDTAFVDTWAVPDLPAGGTRSFRWRVTPVQAGRHELRWTVAAGLTGKAKAQTASGAAPVTGTFEALVSDRPAQSRIDPDTGEVVRSRG